MTTSPEPSLPRSHPPMRLGRRLRKARKHHQKLLRRIDKAVAEENPHKARALGEKLLKSADARLVAAADSNMRMKRGMRTPTHQLEAMAAEINAWRPIADAVTAHAVDKAGWDFRVVMSFPHKWRATHLLCRRAIEGSVSLDPRQHAYRNGGRDEAVKRVLRELDAGKKWCVQLDINEFYRSIDRRRLYQIIPLPCEVIDNVVGPPGNILPGRIGNAIGPISLVTVSREGISQGSSLSPLIAEAVIATALRDLRSTVSVINYGDNFELIARTRAELRMAITALTGAFRRSPHGPFRLTDKSGLRRVCDGFEFLGYHFRMKRGRIHCRPSKKSEVKFFTSALRLMRDIAQRRQPDAAIKLQRSALGWVSAFSQWRTNEPLFWTGFWLRGVAHQHCPAALRTIAELTEVDDERFVRSASPLPTINPPGRFRRSQVEHWN
ncbi:MAG TPA: reverse transcriptase domain-containing protein [Croceibacterium sp.]|nr:reverse transcriptase domain-containing protein [Croceibacterium sp.]